jgi:ABC-2 type transport system ATP-binding protein
LLHQLEINELFGGCFLSPAIEIANLSKIYPRTWRRPSKQALQNVSFKVDVGETFGFVGQNGAGKSTLIKILVGALRPTNGSVRLFGRDTETPESRMRLGFVPENPSLPDHLTPLEILRMARRMHRLESADSESHCKQWLRRFDLSSVENAPLRGFSKGMLQRTALAHAMVIAPRLLILDEPLSGLDPVGRKDVVDILQEYKESGGTLFFSSHVLYDVERIADRFGLIHGGRLLTIRSPSEILAGQTDRFVVRYRRNDGGAGQQIVVGAEELPMELSRLRGEGFYLQEVKPELSLESVFFKAISGDSKDTA